MAAPAQQPDPKLVLDEKLPKPEKIGGDTITLPKVDMVPVSSKHNIIKALLELTKKYQGGSPASVQACILYLNGKEEVLILSFTTEDQIKKITESKKILELCNIEGDSNIVFFIDCVKMSNIPDISIYSLNDPLMLKLIRLHFMKRFLSSYPDK